MTVTEIGGSSLRPFLVVPTDGTPTLNSAVLPGPAADKLRSLAPATSGAWEVRAYDSKGKVVARTPQSRSFVVGPGKNKP